MRRSIHSRVAVIGCMLLATEASASYSDDDGDSAWDEEQAAERDAELDALGTANFEAVMNKQQYAPVPSDQPRSGAEIYQQRSQAGTEIYQQGSESGKVPPTVEVELGDFEGVRTELDSIHKKAATNLGPAVVLGAAEYDGDAREGALSLTLTLQVTLGHPDLWKTVPLAGDDAVLVQATANGVSVPLSRQNGYHVWVTQKTGEVTLRVELLVPSRGLRGSIEYDFFVARTPETRFTCRFPVPGLEPRLSSAVQTEAKTVGSTTHFSATLAPTTRIHLIGFRDLDTTEGRTARVFAETTSLLSLDETTAELFTVIRYTILYAGAKEFQVQIPEGAKVLLAEGRGAFRFELEPGDTGTLLRGETAYPIRNSFEISLRLRRDMPANGNLSVVLPYCLGVEREQGWLGVEVTGKVQTKDGQLNNVRGVDVRQLPAEMIQNAVSPILHAYRYHDGRTASVELVATRLPEREPASGSIDRVHAISVISTDGQVLTDMRITLRNRLAHTLTLSLPANTDVRSSLLDGEPVKPSLAEGGGLLLPLKRSSGHDRLDAFTLQVILAGKVSPLGLVGSPNIDLPSMDLPISSLAWSLYLPARNIYGSLRGDVRPQQFVGTASWHQPIGGGALTNAVQDVADANLAESAGGGAMPVRIKLPERGTRLEYERYWIEGGRPVQLSVVYLRSWLRMPISVFCILIFAIGVALVSSRWWPHRPHRPDRVVEGNGVIAKLATLAPPAGALWVGLTLLALMAWPTHKLAGESGIVLAVLLGGVAVVWRLGWLGSFVQLRCWALALPASFKEREKQTWGIGRVLKLLILSGFFFVFGIGFAVALVQLLALLVSPLPG